MISGLQQALAGSALALLCAPPLMAQDTPPEESVPTGTESAASPAEDAAVSSADEAAQAPAMREFTDEEIAAIAMPELSFEENDRIVGDYEKYFYFHREDTSFSEAYADIVECDQLSSGISYYASSGEPYPGYFVSQYGIGGAIGGAIGAVLADAIHGSAARRKVRRINMRNCMGFKGYQRYGLEKALWKEFNFEEGNGRKRDDVREAALLQQARVASGDKPATQELGI